MKCPKPENLFEFVSIPEAMSFTDRVFIRTHVFVCKACKEKSESLLQSWKKCLSPTPDVTTSLMRVYSRLQKDETLILKGWKLGDSASRRNVSSILFKEGWLFRGAVGIGLAAAVSFVIYREQSPSAPRAKVARVPFAQIRVEQKNSVRVHYVQPELLQTVEFETTSGQ
jgi:hypothetical protein